MAFVLMDGEEYKELVFKANKCDELQRPKMANAEDKIEKIEIKKVTLEEKGKIMGELKNKIIGGEE